MHACVLLLAKRLNLSIYFIKLIIIIGLGSVVQQVYGAAAQLGML